MPGGWCSHLLGPLFSLPVVSRPPARENFFPSWWSLGSIPRNTKKLHFRHLNSSYVSSAILLVKASHKASQKSRGRASWSHLLTGTAKSGGKVFPIYHGAYHFSPLLCHNQKLSSNSTRLLSDSYPVELSVIPSLRGGSLQMAGWWGEH